MAAANFFKACYFNHFSKPSSDRILYRVIQKQRVRSILELGIGTGCRALRMIEFAKAQSPSEQIGYVGIDLFESRRSADGPGVSLKRAHQMFGGTGARIQLIPGDPFSGLARTANGLMKIDLVVISARQDPDSLGRAWFYLPRVIHAGSYVFREESIGAGNLRMCRVEPDEIARLSDQRSVRRAA